VHPVSGRSDQRRSCWDYSTCDAVMVATAIDSFCFCTAECRVYLLASPMPMQSSRHMGSVPKIP
jgi:hypothetical protein